MDQVIMEINNEEEEAFRKDPAVWLEVYDWQGEEETKIRVGPEWSEEDILEALAKVGTKPHPVLSRVFGFMQYVSRKTLEGQRSLQIVEEKLLDPEGVLSDEEGERLLEWREYLTDSVSLGEAVAFETIKGDYAPWGALERLRFYKDHRNEIDEVISQLEALAMEAEAAALEQEEAGQDEEVVESESAAAFDEQEEGPDDVEDEGEEELDSDSEDFTAYLDDGEILV